MDLVEEYGDRRSKESITISYSSSATATLKNEDPYCTHAGPCSCFSPLCRLYQSAGGADKSRCLLGWFLSKIIVIGPRRMMTTPRLNSGYRISTTTITGLNILLAQETTLDDEPIINYYWYEPVDWKDIPVFERRVRRCSKEQSPAR
jgi:hypothetical protein